MARPRQKSGEKSLRFRIQVIEEAAAIFTGKDASEAPWVLLKRLDVLNLDDQDVAWFGAVDLEWARQIMDSSEVDIFYIVGGVVVSYLAARPIYAFDFYDLAFFDLATEGN